MRLTFVVGTGRCGSTLLSSMLREHPQVLSVSELFAAIGPEVLARDQLSGSELWETLVTPRRATALLGAHGLVPDEVLYPMDGSGRWAAADVPPICLTALPHLTGDPEGLYDELARVVPGFPPAPVGRQFERLFAWLLDRFGREVVVERSGGSLEWLGALRRAFPDATYVHLIRDGAACALSMSRHPVFRLHRVGVQMAKHLGHDPYADPRPDDAHAVPEPLRSLLPDRFDVAAWQALDIPVDEFGWVWSALVMAAVPVLAEMPERALHTMRYEQMLAHPEPVLRALLAFLSLDDPGGGWVADACSKIRPEDPRRREMLQAEQRLQRSVARASRSLRRWPSAVPAEEFS